MAEVSIIVPVYQVEKYIRQCIESILAQTFTDIEVILVDDGSRDQSGKICDAYAKKDGRVKVIHKENEGLSDARNTGMNYMSGDYFMFVDSDDYIAPAMVEDLYKGLIDNNADIAACNYLYYFENDKFSNFSTNIKSEILSGTDIFYNRKNERNYGIWTVVWNKLYKKETFENIRFRAGKFHEDEFWANDIYQLDVRVVMVSECLYYYRQRSSSIMGEKSAKRELDILEAFQERIYTYLQKEEYAAQAYKVMIYSLEHLVSGKKLAANKEEQKQFLQAEANIKSIIRRLKKQKLSRVQRASLIFIEMNPCFMFEMGMKFRKILERFL